MFCSLSLASSTGVYFFKGVYNITATLGHVLFKADTRVILSKIKDATFKGLHLKVDKFPVTSVLRQGSEQLSRLAAA